MAQLPQMVRAFGVTFLAMFKKVTTEQYPEEKDLYPPKPRFHGRHQLPEAARRDFGQEIVEPRKGRACVGGPGRGQNRLVRLGHRNEH